MSNEYKIKNGLIVQGQINATGITASLSGTASYAITASALLGGVVSSSYAGTASVLLGSISSASYATSASYSVTAGNAQAITFVPTVAISASAASSSVSASFSTTAANLIGLNFNNTGSIISTPTTQVAVISLSTGSYLAAFFDYAAVSASNIRAGTVFGSWVNGSLTYSEVSNVDVGDTSPVTMSLGLNGSILQLSASVSSVPWTIKALGRYI